MSSPTALLHPSRRERNLLSCCLWTIVVIGWATVFLGAYVIYPWYRAVPLAGVVDLAGFPQRLLISSPRTSEWHNLGMEWKEHVAWLAPIAMTMVAYIFAKYGPAFGKQREIRTAVLTFALVAFVTAGLAGLFGAFLNKYAPVRGGATIQIIEGGSQ